MAIARISSVRYGQPRARRVPYQTRKVASREGGGEAGRGWTQRPAKSNWHRALTNRAQPGPAQWQAGRALQAADLTIKVCCADFV